MTYPPQQPPDPGGYGEQPPGSGSGGYGAPPPGSGGYGEQPPGSGSGGYGAAPPGSGGYGAPPPGAGGYGTMPPPPPGAGGYGQPQSQPPSKTPLVLSIIGIICWFLCSPASIVLGFIAQGQFRRQGRSDTVAKVAWIGGIVLLALGIILVITRATTMHSSTG